MPRVLVVAALTSCICVHALAAEDPVFSGLQAGEKLPPLNMEVVTA